MYQCIAIKHQRWPLATLGLRTQSKKSFYHAEYLEDPSSAAAAAAAQRAAATATKVAVSMDDVTVPISLSLAVMVSYICGGALLFGQWEVRCGHKYSFL